MFRDQNTLTVDTMRLLKAVLPSSCIWTGLRDSEGFGFKDTLNELNAIYSGRNDETMETEEPVSPSIPQAIRDMIHDRNAVEALGAMIW
jgi:DNA mismatch repair protein MSH6